MNSLLRVFSCTLGIFTIVFLLAIHPANTEETLKIRNWLCYYGKTFGHEFYSKFDLVVLDAYNHPPLMNPQPKRPKLMGYLSVGEVDLHSPLWPLAKNKPYLIKKNEFWDSWIVDVRDPDWQSLLFNIGIPAVFEQGFDGIFLDTFDSSLSLLHGEGGEKFKGIKKNLLDIVQRIRGKYPRKLIAVNRGLPIFPGIASSIDLIVVEDLYSYYQGNEQGYIKVGEQTRNILLQQINLGLEVNPALKVLTLDYAGYGQRTLAREAISYSREKGFIPYVSTYKLDQIFYYTLDH